MKYQISLSNTGTEATSSPYYNSINLQSGGMSHVANTVSTHITADETQRVVTKHVFHQQFFHSVFRFVFFFLSLLSSCFLEKGFLI